MKYIILESRFDRLIYEYLNRNYIPDGDGWGPEIYPGVSDEIEINGYMQFHVDDKFCFLYVGSSLAITTNERTLYVTPHVVDNLTGLFGNRWHNVIVEWFEGGTGVKVDHLDLS